MSLFMKPESDAGGAVFRFRFRGGSPRLLKSSFWSVAGRGCSLRGVLCGVKAPPFCIRATGGGVRARGGSAAVEVSSVHFEPFETPIDFSSVSPKSSVTSDASGR
jgi:hypothetical protein